MALPEAKIGPWLPARDPRSRRHCCTVTPGFPSLHRQCWERPRGAAGHHLDDLAACVEFSVLCCPPRPCIVAMEGRFMSALQRFANGASQGWVLLQASLNIAPWRRTITGPAVGPWEALQDRGERQCALVQGLRLRMRRIIPRCMRSSVSAGSCSRTTGAATVSRRSGVPVKRAFAPTK